MRQHNIGVSTWLWESPFANKSIELFPKIKSMGFDLVEIPIEDPSLIDPGKVLEGLTEHDLKVSICAVLGPDKDLTSDDRSIQINGMEYISNCIRVARELNAGFIAGPLYASVGKARHVSYQQRKKEWNRAVTNLKEMCKHSGDNGIKLALEPLNRFESDMINTSEDVMRLVDEVDHSSACVALDSFHMTIEETNIFKAIEQIGDKLIHFQVSENQRGVPGTGNTPWEDLRRGLLAISYQGDVVIESFNPKVTSLANAVCIWKKFTASQDQFALEGLQFLRKLLTSNKRI